VYVERHIDTTAAGGRAPARPPGPLDEVEGIDKAFGAVQALKGVSLAIHPGSVHGLIGANGAGKSTLIRCLAGVVRPDAGEIRVGGEVADIASPGDANDLGFAFLHQELNLVQKFDGLDNMTLGLVRSGRFGLADKASARRRARQVVDDIGLEVDLERPVEELSVANQWLIALGRSLMRRARLIAFDEPTAALSARETEALFKVVQRLAADGIGVLYVSHRLEEMELLCDAVTGFRDGRVVVSLDRAGITRSAMISAITGGDPEALMLPPAEHSEPGKAVLEARNMTRAGVVEDASLRLCANEIVGIAGLVGSGRSEFARMLFGADRIDSGEILIDGEPARIASPADASRAGMGLVPEERRTAGLFLDKSAAFNMSTTFPSVARSLLRTRKGRQRARTVAEQVDLKPLALDLPARKFSGGNQQKLVLGRWLMGSLRILLLDEPTRGIDIGARTQIHRMMRKLADDGMALLMISSDFEELLNCDRVLVMVRGRITEELREFEITEERMLRAAYGGAPDPTDQHEEHER
jgi:ABC-type sugar transport system ATPase subunit